jgi:hypothetical protein
MPQPTDPSAEGGPPGDAESGMAPENRQPQSGTVIGTVADLKEGEILLPNFAVRKPEGLFADLSILEKKPGAFEDFVNRIFSADVFLSKLDLRIFSMLLFEPEKAAKARAMLEASGQLPYLRFARDIVKFPEERKPLYRSVKIAPDLSDAKYFFEPLMLDRTVVSVGENGSPVTQTITEKAFLDFDEFVCHLWKNGVRYGILEGEVRAFLGEKLPKSGWITVARQLDPTPGQDAGIHEECDKLHRDKTPKVLTDGRVDLRHFKNTFPQIGKGVRLIRKIPMVPGTPGRNIAGVPIEPAKPKDLDLNTLAGAWIRLESCDTGEYLVSGMAGFLNIDTKTQQIFMTERLINREGVSVRTTGSLDIQVEQFEEHGDVEKGFSVKGRSIHIKGNVFGTVISKGGILKIGGNVIKGEVHNADGLVEIGGFASNAYLESKNGEVRIKRAENTIIRAKKITTQEVRNCTIVADEVEIAFLQNSVVAGKSIVVQTAGLKQGISERDENVFVVEVPDLAELSRNIAEEAAAITEVERLLLPKKSELDRLRARQTELMENPRVKTYLESAKKVRAFQEKGKTLSPEQAKVFAQLKSQVINELAEIAETSKTVKTLGAEIEPLENTIAERQTNKANYESRLVELSGSVSVEVKAVTGETVVRQRKVGSKTVQLRDIIDPAALRKELDFLGHQQDRVFHAATGSIEWRFDPAARKSEPLN